MLKLEIFYGFLFLFVTFFTGIRAKKHGANGALPIGICAIPCDINLLCKKEKDDISEKR